MWAPFLRFRPVSRCHISCRYRDQLYYVGITEARVGGRVGNPRGLTAPGAGPGSARGRDSPRRPPARGRHSLPGVGPTHFGSNGSRFLKLQPLDTVELYRNACSVIFGPCDEFPDLEHDACRLAFVAPHGANERRGRTLASGLPPGRRARGRRPGVGTHPATGRPGVGPGSGLIWAPRGPGATFTMSPRAVPDPPGPTRASP